MPIDMELSCGRKDVGARFCHSQQRGRIPITVLIALAEHILLSAVSFAVRTIITRPTGKRSWIMKALVKIAVAAAAAVSMSGPAAAAGPQQTVTQFFSDESETTTVGWTIIYC